MASRKKTAVRSNLKRCPLLKITKRVTVKSDNDEILEEVIEEESFSDCYKTYCMAWNAEQKCCTYFGFDIVEEEEEAEDD
jgi:hypothetical protein